MIFSLQLWLFFQVMQPFSFFHLDSHIFQHKFISFLFMKLYDYRGLHFAFNFNLVYLVLNCQFEFFSLYPKSPFIYVTQAKIIRKLFRFVKVAFQISQGLRKYLYQYFKFFLKILIFYLMLKNSLLFLSLFFEMESQVKIQVLTILNLNYNCLHTIPFLSMTQKHYY